MIKGKALKRALQTKDAQRVFDDVPLITDTTEFITPERAHEMLRQNKRNRPTNWRRVEQYCDLMSNGLWKLTPQGIIIDSDGNLMNGQNRLWAVVYSGVSVYMRVSRGTPPDAANAIDRNMPQTARDLASRSTGKKHSPTEASMARAMLAITGQLRPTPDQVAGIIETYAQRFALCLESTAGSKKDKAVIMILAAIVHVSDSDSEVRERVKNLDWYASRLAHELSPINPDKSWSKGALFLLAMSKAVKLI